MIIWGSRGREKCVSQGWFYCPGCDESRTYKLMRMSKYFTLYFVPLFEMEKLGEYVECETCHRTYKVEVLTYQPPSRGERVLGQLRTELESGMPVHMLQKKLMAAGLEQRDAVRLVELATGGNERVCRTCGFTYLGTIRLCPNCGIPIDPSLGPPAESLNAEPEKAENAAIPPNLALTKVETGQEAERDGAEGLDVPHDETDSHASNVLPGTPQSQDPPIERSPAKAKSIVAAPPVPPRVPVDYSQSFEQLAPASMGRRLLAFILDGVVLWLLYFALYFISSDEELGVAGTIPYLYFVMLWAFAGSTFGKWIMGISLVRKDGTAPGFLRANIRFFVMFLLSPLWITWWPALVRNDKRALHDLAAGTMVVPRADQKVNAPAFVFISIVAAAMLWSVKDYKLPFGSAVRRPPEVSQRAVPPSPSAPIVPAVQFVATGTRTVPVLTVQAPTKPRPSVTATATPEATASPWLFADDFVDNRNGWPDSETAYFEGTKYHVWETKEGYSYWVDCRKCGPFSDFVYEAMISKVEGADDDLYGLQFRRNGDTHYTLWISADGYWQFTSYAGDWNEVTDWTHSSAINKGNTRNKLRVVALGSHFEFYANDQYLGSAEDQTFPSSGNLGFGVGSAGLHIMVDYVRVWRPPSTAAVPPSPTQNGVLRTPGGIGGVIVDNYCGFEVNLDIAGQFYTIPANNKIHIDLPPDHYPISATAAGKKFACGRGGCSVDVVEGMYTSFAYCVSSE